jgi:nucleotidyltransferase/DNA polymerase involved in DNA repair
LTVQLNPLDLDPIPADWPEPSIACVWLPQLPLRVEVLRRPNLEGRPLVLGSGSGGRQIVQLCSPEAEQAGIRPGLPLREVLALSRDAVVLQPDPVRTAEVLEEVLNRLQRVSPSVELADERLLLDLRGLRQVYHADLHTLEGAIRIAVPHLLQPRVGLAAGKFTALVAACLAPLPGICLVPPDEAGQFLAPLSIGFLPFETEELQRLDLLGLRTIADLAALPFTAVQAQFGSAGARAWRLAHGEDDEPVIPHTFTPSVRASLYFDEPLASVEAVLTAVDHLLARAFRSPALNGHSVRQVRLRAMLADSTSWERLITFKEALLSRGAARSALRSKLQLPNGLPPAPIEELSLELMQFGGEGAKQASFFSLHSNQEGQIAEAARQLAARYGQTPLAHVIEVEPWSRIPERRWALVPYDL